MTSALRRFLPLGAFVALAAVLGVGLTLTPREVPSPFIGKPAPPFTLPRLDDAAPTLTAAELKGRVWVLTIWASWCAPCREEHPLLVSLARAQPVPIYGLNYKDDPRNAQEWLLKLGDPYAASVVDADGRASIDHGVYGVPESFVIDKAGIVRFKHIGPLTTEVWQRDMLPLVKRLQGCACKARLGHNGPDPVAGGRVGAGRPAGVLAGTGPGAAGRRRRPVPARSGGRACRSPAGRSARGRCRPHRRPGSQRPIVEKRISILKINRF